MTALSSIARDGVERGYGTSKEGTDVWDWEVDSLRERGAYSNFIADPTQIYLRHDAYRQHFQNHTHTSVCHDGSNEQIVRHRVAGTELQDRVHPIGTGKDSGCDAADDGGGVVALDLGGGFEEEELEACSVRWVGGVG